MKIKLILLFILSLYFTHDAYSQWRNVAARRIDRNVFKLNIVLDMISLGFGVHDFGLVTYERAYGALSTSIRPVILTFNTREFGGYGLGGSIIQKAFVIQSERDVPKGVYLGLPLSVYYIYAGETVTKYQGGYGISTGGVTGFQWISNSGFSFEIFVGPSMKYTSIPVTISQISISNSQFNLGLEAGANIGVAF